MEVLLTLFRIIFRFMGKKVAEYRLQTYSIL